ncbi:hypothetical protein K7432_005105 [Basidiobolus ranarum]|uniref:Uncharacterized protein n=1 Tax=Basidiobolus ranarum TaxID=34480 RepID=A0ABR2WX65_9FUNG
MNSSNTNQIPGSFPDSPNRYHGSAATVTTNNGRTDPSQVGVSSNVAHKVLNDHQQPGVTSTQRYMESTSYDGPIGNGPASTVTTQQHTAPQEVGSKLESHSQHTPEAIPQDLRSVTHLGTPHTSHPERFQQDLRGMYNDPEDRLGDGIVEQDTLAVNGHRTPSPQPQDMRSVLPQHNVF